MVKVEETHEDIYIYKNSTKNEDQTILFHTFRLVKSAIDQSMFPSGTTVIKIVYVDDGNLPSTTFGSTTLSHPPLIFRGTVHLSTNHGTVPDKSHLTLALSPGRGSVHLYLLPTDGEFAEASTTVSHLKA